MYPKGYKFNIFLYICTRKGINMKENALSTFVKDNRKKAGLTQVELAEKAGVGLRFVRELERGKTSLRIDKVNLVLNLFGSELGTVPMDRTV